MINILKNILEGDDFKNWLKTPDVWDSLDIDYHPPRVERVWLEYGEMRLSLHVIHPCDADEAILHPHPWKSAMYVLPIGGTYEHGLGFIDEQREEVFGEMELVKYNEIISTQQYMGDVYYEMLNPNGIHYVRPLNDVVYSIMLSGPVIWPENKTSVDKELKPLAPERKTEILQTFKHFFE
jgi:hypothetical protein